VRPELNAAARGYLELLRPANIVTALADVMAGYAIAGLGHPDALAWLLASTAALYGGGVVLNDFFDRELDSIERPERPIPSGRVRPVSAAAFGCTLLVLGVAAATQATQLSGRIAALLAGAVLLYDGWSKRNPRLGPLNMGLCRGLNLLLGISAVPAAVFSHGPIALLPAAYICAVTALSQGEVHGGRRGTALFALGSIAAVIAVLAFLSAMAPGGLWLPPLALTGAFAARVLPEFWKAAVTPDPATIRRAVRRGVLSLVLLDAVLGAVYAGVLYGVLILGTALLAGRLARLFAVT
jgi:hypothetical protein